jgi:hypothetical protein
LLRLLFSFDENTVCSKNVKSGSVPQHWREVIPSEAHKADVEESQASRDRGWSRHWYSSIRLGMSWSGPNADSANAADWLQAPSTAPVQFSESVHLARGRELGQAAVHDRHCMIPREVVVRHADARGRPLGTCPFGIIGGIAQATG